VLFLVLGKVHVQRSPSELSFVGLQDSGTKNKHLQKANIGGVAAHKARCSGFRYRFLWMPQCHAKSVSTLSFPNRSMRSVP
jgi:hypothetical protein